MAMSLNPRKGSVVDWSAGPIVLALAGMWLLLGCTSGNGIHYLYMSDQQEFEKKKGGNPVIVGITDLVTSPETYSYDARSVAFKDTKKNPQPSPERLYRTASTANNWCNRSAATIRR